MTSIKEFHLGDRLGGTKMSILDRRLCGSRPREWKFWGSYPGISSQ